MQTSQKILIGSGVAVLALAAAAAIAGPMIYRDFIAPPAAEAPSLSGDESMLEPLGAAIDPTALVGDWRVADGSEAGYRVDEVLNGTDVTVTGRTDEVTGTFTIGGDGLTLETAELAVDVASISTDSAQRDAYFRDQALRVSEHPTATFVLTQPVTLDEAPASGDVVQAEATGDLTIAGTTRSVTVDVQLRGTTADDGETTADIAGSIPISFADFGVEAPNLGFVQVEPEGFVEFQLTAQQE
ncbi:YceI family protein [Leucobacter tenebrionis]|uniref:YceI family protein n=1 Tax=Leucobacter tenebrionis TaxID=2873270 RepID=UPI001CA60039|nr:YceI family protein [Leucobacter tenebrionis]QZY53171.1 YceI family protein [Leucobacter tenebrionis]